MRSTITFVLFVVSLGIACRYEHYDGQLELAILVKVTDVQGFPIAGATVALDVQEQIGLIERAANSQNLCVTDGQGKCRAVHDQRFSGTRLRAGKLRAGKVSFMLRVSKPGYDTAVVPIDRVSSARGSGPLVVNEHIALERF
jgi:hypothetical protein